MQKIPLDAREYKLLLQTTAVPPGTDQDGAAAFWAKRMVPVVERCLGTDGARKPAHRGTFSKRRVRVVQFWDTTDGLLGANALSLRTRTDEPEGDEATGATLVTLKLRSPDLITAMSADVRGSTALADTKLEEDLSPLVIANRGAKAAPACLAKPPSIRSRFSHSTTQPVEQISTIGDVVKLYPGLKANLAVFGASLPERGEPLVHGPRIDEVVYRGPKVDLGAKTFAQFSLTLWLIQARNKQHGVAEISFKCDIEQGVYPPVAAWRAYRLFVAMQTDLARIMETSELSKTALAIPRRTGNP